MLFDPNGVGRSLLGPLAAAYGATVHWPEKVLSTLQSALLLAFCRLWRKLFHHFKRFPWLLVPLFDRETPTEERAALAVRFWVLQGCCRDRWLGDALRLHICD